MFPNKFNVYIHDTTAKSLFARATRTFSHGCMRVENPLVLAKVILGVQGPAMSAGQIDAVLATGRKKVVRLKKPIRVHVTYLTSWVNKDGSVHFRKDVYSRDKLLASALANASVVVGQ